MKSIITRTIQSQQTLDQFLESLCFSKRNRHLLKMEKRIQVNQQIITHNIQLYENDILTIDCLKEEENHLTPYPINLHILYEDEVVLVVEKPIHLIVHDDGNTLQTLDHAISYYYHQTNQQHPVLHVHRLDKDTSGCILYCKQSYLLPYFDEQLKRKEIKRTYLAIVEGDLNEKMTLRSNIGKDRHQNKYRISKTGLPACTHVMPIKNKHHKTLVKCQLETGRTHQIRVHLSSIHHALIGDELYGKKTTMRCALHSYEITFTHPMTQQKITVTSPLPLDMKKCMEAK